MSSGETVKIGLLGMGTVGGGVAQIIEDSGELLAGKTGARLLLERVLVRDPARGRTVELPPQTYTTDPDTVIKDPSIDVVVELMGGIEPARTLISTALQEGKHVVTANKDLMAQHGRELLQLARRCGRNIFYEASVGGGIPLIRPLKRCLVANRIERMIGIINGTTNYILTRMFLDDMDFQEALDKARELGFAEADPSSDLEGRDAAYKLTILAGIAFNCSLNPDDFPTRGITGVTRADIHYARELGYTIKLLAVAEEKPEGLALGVYPALVPLAHPLATVQDEFNAIFIKGDLIGEAMFYGRGAGALPTASAVVADIIEVARSLQHGGAEGAPPNSNRKPTLLPPAALTSRFYVRLLARDRPGVFGALAAAFGEEEVSLDMIIQKRRQNGIAEIVLVTHDVNEERFNRSLQRVARLPAIEPDPSVFRVLA
ncbi:MAG: homoserine dehydrogenase [Firmicutes bacterium]|nr:homoserine dehydrogenase [Bacillota bacterium]